MQKCWEADIDYKIYFKEIVTELSKNENYKHLSCLVLHIVVLPRKCCGFILFHTFCVICFKNT